MNKAQKRILLISTVSALTLGAFAGVAFIIINQGNKIVKDNTIDGKYPNWTKYLDWNNGELNINKMSILDWINLNMPEKLLIESGNNGSQLLSFYAKPTNDITNKENLLAFNSTNINEIKKLNTAVNSPLIAKMSINKSDNSFNYNIKFNDFFTNIKEQENELLNPLLFDSIVNKNNENKYIHIESKKISNELPSYTLNIIKNDEIERYDNFDYWKTTLDKYNIHFSYGKDTNQTRDVTRVEVKSIKDTTNQNILFGMERTYNPTDGDFDIIYYTKHGEVTNYMTSRYTRTKNISDTNYQIYNISYTFNNNSITKQNYQTYWSTKDDSTIPLFHLPKEIGFINLYDCIDLAKLINNKK